MLKWVDKGLGYTLLNIFLHHFQPDIPNPDYPWAHHTYFDVS